MELMTIQEIAKAIGAEGNFPGAVSEISTDTRTLPKGCLFVALTGERFNGHEYIKAALEQGAAYAVAQEHRDYGYPEKILYTDDTQHALMAIGRAYRSKFAVHCIGITGSVGKTTTKDMIAAVVAAGFKTLKTEGNLNNEIGLPKTLFNLDPSYEAAVVEMGMQGLGEIAALAAVAQPQMGVITNIGVCHIEQLGSRENILKAKMELADALPDGAGLFLCGDNDLLSGVRIPRLHVQFYGIENPACTIRAREIKEEESGTDFTMLFPGGAISVAIPCVGKHNVLNALAACGVGMSLGIPVENCVAALKNYVPSGMRQKVVKCGNYTVVEDCYNASPDSMRAALTTLAGYPCTGRRIAVLGDMLELGLIAEEAHREIGMFAAQNKVDLLFAYGELAEQYQLSASAQGVCAYHFTDQGTLLERLKKELGVGDVVWVKGSHGMHMEEILRGLYAEERQNG